MITPPSRCTENGQNFAARPHVTHEIELKRQIPLFITELVERPDGARPNVVDQDVNLAVIRLQKVVDTLRDTTGLSKGPQSR